ncbi:MAG TPA: Fic family protein [Candidatus Binatia bacterium]|nr:Fic family protein [Candidatus Binatia bacterium]
MTQPLHRAVLLAIHRRVAGAGSGVRDAALLEDALLPRRGLRGAWDLADSAAALAYCLARLRPFADGNLRTAHAACATFLAVNGAGLAAPPQAAADSILALAEGRLRQAEFAAWLRTRLAARARRTRAGSRRRA